MAEIVTLPGPLLARVNALASLDFPTSVVSKAIEAGAPLHASTGSTEVVPRPVSTMLFGELKAFDVITTLSAELAEVGIRSVFVEFPGTSHEWQTWRRSLHEFAPLLFQK